MRNQKPGNVDDMEMNDMGNQGPQQAPNFDQTYNEVNNATYTSNNSEISQAYQKGQNDYTYGTYLPENWLHNSFKL